MKKFLGLVLALIFAISCMSAFAEAESVTTTTDEHVAAIVNAAWASGEYEYEVITYGQQMVDKVRNLNTTVPMYGKDADGNFRIGTYLLETAIYTYVDKEALDAKYDEIFGNVTALKMDMPAEGEGQYLCIGSFDPEKVWTEADDSVIACMQNSEVMTETTEEGYRVLYPIIEYTMQTVGVIEYVFRIDEGRSTVQYDETAAYFARMINETVQSYAFLLDPYTKGFKADDMLCQKIEQIILARHPEISVLSFHITDPDDPEAINKLYAINRPNFQYKVATEVTVEAEASGRITMCLLPSVRRMEAHVPLYNRTGEFVGVLVTVYVFDNLDEGADLYARSMAIMYEASQLLPENFEEMFQP